MAWASASSLRLFRSFALALGFAVILTVAPGAMIVPADASPGAAASPARIEQEPGDPDVSVDPADPDVSVDPADEAYDDGNGAEGDTLAPASPVKSPPIVPDSLRFGKGAMPPVGGAPAETLGYQAPGIGVGAAGKPAIAKPKERRTLFGIHPAAFFVLLAVGHIFIVRLVTN